MPTILGTPHSEKHRKNLKGMGVGYEISCIWAPKGKNWGPQQGCRFRFFDASGLVPPPSLWTDASAFLVDASGLVPPHPPIRFGQGGGRGGQTATY